ncbi:hypothetical protein RHS04_04094 [Rhizoctonia solani]|uniref:Uncharacterized protein n=2 Tax=Rhizoctonia solani TaxID=456999 RepID=A0A8H7H764_9AGAM|nr:hypothetical protein RHS04_04094 [Rhizoctonia solani]
MSDHPRRAIPPHEPQVNTLIAKSRREHALHNRSQRHDSAPTPLFSALTLSHQLRVYPRIRVAGPPPPRSWAYPTSTSVGSAVSSGATPDPQWRAHATRWIFLHLDQPGLIPHAVSHLDEGQNISDILAVPTLREMCVRSLVSLVHNSDAEARSTIHENILDPDLPGHLRRFIVRYSAIHSPLSWIALAQLWGIEYGEQGADGEVILVGPDAGGPMVAASAIKQLLAPPDIEPDTQSENEDYLTWDAEEHTSAPPMKAFISITHPISKYLTLFPPTITHLALVAIPLDRDVTPRIVMARLSHGLRLLEALDLSCNPWLDTINSVDWPTRWLRLRFAAFINCPKLKDLESLDNVINSKRSWERSVHIDWT